MNTLSQIVDKFEKLLERLPGAIQKPVEREWRPIKELFLLKRPPRVVLIGTKPEAFLEWLVGADAYKAALARATAEPTPDQAHLPSWNLFRHKGLLHWVSAEAGVEAVKHAILSNPPDVFLVMPGDTAKGVLGREEFAALKELHRFDREQWKNGAPILAVTSAPVSFSERLRAEADLAESVASTCLPSPQADALAALAKALPEEAQLEFARLSGDKNMQHRIADRLSRSCTAVCAAIGAQPIPLADFPILTSLQLALVAGIMQVAGREFGGRTAADFVAALGVSLGAGLVLREGARAAVKLVPGWGNAISGAIAGAGTYALGRAAAAYFIDGISLEDARKMTWWRKERAKLVELPPK